MKSSFDKNLFWIGVIMLNHFFYVKYFLQFCSANLEMPCLV
jgi:hypothetical protein